MTRKKLRIETYTSLLFFMFGPALLASPLYGEGLTFELRNQVSGKSRLQVEICDYMKGTLSTFCVQTPANKAVSFNRTGIFHITEKDLKRMLDAGQGRSIQFRFRDTVNRTSMFWTCKEHPYTIVDGASPEKRFHIDVIGSHLASYACRVFREEDQRLLVEEETNKPLFETVAQKFTEYKKWIANEEGLTFSVENKVYTQKPRIRVRVCSYSKLGPPLNCIFMNETDFIHYNQTRIYHVTKAQLDRLLEVSDDHNKVQFSFEDTVNNIQNYKPCLEHSFISIESPEIKGASGHRFEIVVKEASSVTYSCDIRSK